MTFKSNKRTEVDMEPFCVTYNSYDDIMTCGEGIQLCTEMPEDINQMCGQLCSINMGEVFDDITEEDGLRQSECEFHLTTDNDGDSELHTAIICKDVAAIMMLLNHSMSLQLINAKNRMQQTPLHLAVLTGLISVVRKLVMLGCDVTSRDRNGNTALHLACREGQIDIVRNLLLPVHRNKISEENISQQKSSRFLIPNYFGQTCLHLAAARGDLDIVKLMLDNGADCNAKEGKTGRTILHQACIDGNLELVRMLTKLKSCNINAKAFDGLTPFDFARTQSSETVNMVLAAAGARYGYETTNEEF